MLKREDLLKEITSFDNGHAEYMVKNIDKEALIDCAIEYRKNYINSKTIGNVHEKNGMVYFTTCEKDFPDFSIYLSEEFPGAFVYATVCCDFNVLYTYYKEGGEDISFEEGKEKYYNVSVENCFVNDEGLRIDLDITDKETGASLYVGDLFCVNSEDALDALKEVIETGENNTQYCDFDTIAVYLDLCPEIKELIEKNNIYDELKSCIEEEAEK